MFLLFYEQYLEIMVKRGWLVRIVQRTSGIPQRMAPSSENKIKIKRKLACVQKSSSEQHRK
jgi:hypothetical protein